ncbi:MAG: HAMP domain-containing protein, partial [Gemmatimonadetes bacterium]|nr:HAMP domain-containing protein [Gemmatimonadota bacterium]
VDGWEDRVLLIASRAQLRISLQEYGETGNPDDLDRIQRILSDVTASVPSIAALAVYDDRATLLARVGLPADSLAEPLSPRFSPGASSDVQFLGAAVTDRGYPRVGYTTPLNLEGERVGYLLVVLNGARLLDLTDDHVGLGETGELMIVMPDPEGARTLHPVRHATGEGEPAASVLLSGPDDPATRVLADTVGRVWTDGGAVDYREKRVWAASRYLSKTGWGLVVKLDAEEETAVIHEFRDKMFALAMTLAGIGVFVAVILGFRFAMPIHSLAEVAERFGDGDLDARATVGREDEIGLLARTFNEMAEELQTRMVELHEFHKFFDVSLDLLCIAGTDGYFKRTNPAFEKALGWDQEKLLSRPFLDLVHPDDVKATENEIAKLAQGVPTISFVNRFRCADGTWKYLRWNSYPEPDTGLLYAIAREIEEPRDA